MVRSTYYVYTSEVTTNGDGGDDIATVNFKLTESFPEQVGDMWQGGGFNARSEFIRYTLRGAVEFPTFDRDELVALLEAKTDTGRGKRRAPKTPASDSARTSDDG